jgi:hypothetical protein
MKTFKKKNEGLTSTFVLERKLGFFDSTMTLVGILMNIMIEKPVESLAGWRFTRLGIPVYSTGRKKEHSIRNDNKKDKAL